MLTAAIEGNPIAPFVNVGASFSFMLISCRTLLDKSPFLHEECEEICARDAIAPTGLAKKSITKPKPHATLLSARGIAYARFLRGAAVRHRNVYFKAKNSSILIAPSCIRN